MLGNELDTMLNKYKHPDITKRDIGIACRIYADLQPNSDVYIFNDGSSKELIYLRGTIPVTYKGSVYNIPVALWLVETHPMNPPMCFVQPTSNMQIKPSKHVDANGKVYLPYLHEWKHPESDVQGLLEIMKVEFGLESPVFSKSAAQPPARPPYPPAHPTGYPMPDASQYNPYANSQYSPKATSYPETTSTSSTATTAMTYTQNTNTLELSEEQIKASLMSAVQDKMKRRLKEVFMQAQAEMDALHRTQDDLNAGKQRLEEILSSLDAKQSYVESNMRVLQERQMEMEKVMSEMSLKQDAVDIDEAVVTTAPLYKQLLTLYAEENATEDTIYFLGEGLRKGHIDMDSFLKHVRELSRKQFILRATMQKCRQKAGLPQV